MDRWREGGRERGSIDACVFFPPHVVITLRRKRCFVHTVDPFVGQSIYRSVGRRLVDRSVCFPFVRPFGRSRVVSCPTSRLIGSVLPRAPPFGLGLEGLLMRLASSACFSFCPELATSRRACSPFFPPCVCLGFFLLPLCHGPPLFVCLLRFTE